MTSSYPSSLQYDDHAISSEIRGRGCHVSVSTDQIDRVNQQGLSTWGRRKRHLSESCSDHIKFQNRSKSLSNMTHPFMILHKPDGRGVRWSRWKGTIGYRPFPSTNKKTAERLSFRPSTTSKNTQKAPKLRICL